MTFTLINAVVGVLVLVALDTVIGILKAGGGFSLSKLPSFLETAVPLPWMASTVVLGVLQAVQPSGNIDSKALAAAFLTALATISAKLVADIAGKIA